MLIRAAAGGGAMHYTVYSNWCALLFTECRYGNKYNWCRADYCSTNADDCCDVCWVRS